MYSPFHKNFYSPFIICIVGILIYSNSFNCSFHFDDYENIVQNPAIQDITDVSAWWEYSVSRPVAMFTFAINYYFHQYDVRGYHLVNLIIHILNALLVYWLFLQTLSTPLLKTIHVSKQKNIIALFAGLVFIAHPVQTQAVTYIIQRMTSLAVLFYLLSVNLYISARITPKKRNVQYLLFLFSTISAILGMLTKEITFTLPVVIILYEFTFLKTKRWRSQVNKSNIFSFVAIFLILLLFIPMLLSFDFSLVFRTIQPQQGHTYTLTGKSYLVTQFQVIATYIRLLFLPVNQNFDYDFPVYNSLRHLNIVASILFLSTIFIAGILLYKRNKLLSFGILWFFITLSIESSIIPIPNVIFEHRLYLPAIGFVFFLAGILYHFSSNRHYQIIRISLIIIIGIYSIMTFQRNKVWQNEFTLWNDVLKKAPKNARAWASRSIYFLRNNEPTKALADLDRSLAINPDYFDALNNRGNVYHKLGKYNLALQDFNKAHHLRPDFSTVLNNRGLAYLALNDYQKAIADFTNVLTNYPDAIETLNNRAQAYQRSKQYINALEDYTRVLSIDPVNSEALFNSGVLFTEQKKYDRALHNFTIFIKSHPDNLDARYHRATLYKKEGDYEKAIRDFTEFINLAPNNPAGYQNRGFLYAQLKMFTNAISDLSKAISLDPGNLQAYNNRGNTFAMLKQYDKAIRDFSHILAVDPDHTNALYNRSLCNFYKNNITEAYNDAQQCLDLGISVDNKYLTELRSKLAKKK